MTVFDIYGLRIRTELRLDAPESYDDRAPVDVDAVAGRSCAVPFQRPNTDVIAELILDGVPRYTFCAVDDGYLGRVYSLADFEISSDLRRVTAHVDTGVDPEVAPILFAGTILAFVLAMRGNPVIHASCVELDGRAIAFAGVSGRGKTTLAALLCSEGGRLITDDVLRLRFDGHGVVSCLGPSPALRLRAGAMALADRFEVGVAERRTADERVAVTPARPSVAEVPLHALVLPRPDREIDEVVTRQLPQHEAAFSLARLSRIEGWRSPRQLKHLFQWSNRLAVDTPVLEVHIPWGPPFARTLAASLAEAVGLDVPPGCRHAAC